VSDKYRTVHGSLTNNYNNFRNR